MRRIDTRDLCVIPVFISVAQEERDSTVNTADFAMLAHRRLGGVLFTEDYVDDADHIVAVPKGSAEVGVLLEPLTVVEKGIAQAYEIQRRLRVWRPRRAAVVGTGTIGLLATLMFRLRGRSFRSPLAALHLLIHANREA